MNLPFGSSASYDDSGSRMRIIAVVAGVLLVAVLGYLLVSGGLFGGVGPSPKQKIVVANQDIPAYTSITAEMVSVIDADADDYLAGAASSAENVVGSMAQAPIYTRQVIYSNQISKIDMAAGGNPLFMTLSNGQRAMSLEVDKVTGVSNLLKVGNRVDIIATYTGDGGAAATTILQNITILALGQRLTNTSSAPAPSSGDSGSSNSNSGSNNSGSNNNSSSSNANTATTYDTVTLQLPSLEDGQKLALALHLKDVTVTLALRSQEDNEIVQISTINATEVIGY